MKHLVIWSLVLLCTCFAQDTQKHAEDSKEPIPDPIANQHNAARAMRTLNSALASYYVSYAVYPDNLGALAVPAGDIKDINQDHAGLLTEPLACAKQPCTFHNYLFTYKKTDAGYVISARPKKYGVDGKSSLYSDESGVIRGTVEDREATGKDKPVGANYY